jgi:hypothetical protein
MTPEIGREIPRLSVQSLRTYDDCPRQFAMKYQLNRYWPAPRPADLAESRSDRVSGTEVGNLIHRLIEVRQLGLDPEPLLAANDDRIPELRRLWEAFLASGHADPAPEAEVWTEQPLYFSLEGVPFIVRFDRLVKDRDRWQILDWKTGHLDETRLRQTWQTKLYPFALVEAGHALGHGPIRPEQVMLVYWEVARGKGHPISYDAATHAAARREFIARAQAVKVPFGPELPDDPRFPRRSAHCGRCSFDSLCNGDRLATPSSSPPLPRFSLDAGCQGASHDG